MKNHNIQVESVVSSSYIGSKIRDYQLLVKLRLSLTVVFSAVMAFVIAGKGQVEWGGVIILALGGFLITGAANALNEVLEKDYDILMKRTMDRPVAAGRMTSSEAVLAAGLMTLGGICLLALFNVWAAFLGMLALVSYAFVYTPMKRVSSAAVFVGALPGALPTLIGCAAVEGAITPLGLTLFGIQFFWQFPHFWSIGWLGAEDYNKAGYQLVRQKDGQPHPDTGLHSALFCLLQFPFMYALWQMDAIGMGSLLALCLSIIIFAGFGMQLYKKQDRKSALALMITSLVYLPFVLTVLFIEIL